MVVVGPGKVTALVGQSLLRMPLAGGHVHGLKSNALLGLPQEYLASIGWIHTSEDLMR